MKILIKECKKIMDIRVLLVIAVFTVLFYHLFLEVTIYPAGGQTTNSQYDMPFYAELIESWGTSLPREDWSKLDEKMCIRDSSISWCLKNSLIDVG